MKMCKKVFCLLLCLSLSFACPSLANETLLKGEWNETEGSRGAKEENGVLLLPLQNSAGLATDFIEVHRGTEYTLSFTYSLPQEEKGIVKISGHDKAAEDAASGAIVPVTPLPKGENKSYEIKFTPDMLSNGNKVQFVKVYFESIIVSESKEKFLVKDVSLLFEPQSIPVSNGSAEITEGNCALGIVGGMLIQNTAIAKHGKNMMEIRAGETMHMSLFADEVEKLAKIRGFLRQGEALGENGRVTISIRTNTKDGKILAEKTMYADDVSADAWKMIRFSALEYDERLVVSIAVSGSGSVYADGFYIENDGNLLRNPRFIAEGKTDKDGKPVTWCMQNTFLNTLIKHENDAYVYLNDVYTDKSTGAKVTALQMDGNCPDGQNYITVQGNGMVLIDSRDSIPVKPGELYRISVWVRTSGTGARIYLNTDTAKIKDAYPGWDQFIVDTGFQNKWREIVFTLRIPEEMETLGLWLRTPGDIDESASVSFNMPSIEKIEESEIGFYMQTMVNAGGTFVPSPALEPYGYAFQNVLGESVEELDAISDSVTAIGILPEEKPNAVMILAAYAHRDGKRELLYLSIGEKASTPTWNTGVTDKNGRKVNGTTYPLATVQKSDIEEADEIRAFLWDVESGLLAESRYGRIDR